MDHIIGSKLSQKYRFEEGAERQKQALIKEFNDHCRTAPPNHTAFCCQWCTDNGDAQIAIDNLIEELTKQLDG